MRANVAAWLLVAMVALSGCTEDPSEDSASRGQGLDMDPETNAGGATRVALGTGLRPVWFPGLTFTYEVTYPAFGARGTMEILVPAALDGRFVFAVNASDELLLGALAYGFPVLGTVDEETFVHRFAGQQTDLFAFPIEANDTWPVEFGGNAITVTAQIVDVSLDMLTPVRSVDAFEMSGTNDGGDVLRYVYTAEASNLIALDYDEGGDGDYEVTMRMTGLSVDGRFSRYHTFDPTPVQLSTDGPIPITNRETRTFALGPDATDAYLSGAMMGDLGRFLVEVGWTDEDNQAILWDQTNATQQVQRFGLHRASPGADGTITHTVAGNGTIVSHLFQTSRIQANLL